MEAADKQAASKQEPKMMGFRGSSHEMSWRISESSGAWSCSFVFVLFLFFFEWLILCCGTF